MDKVFSKWESLIKQNLEVVEFLQKPGNVFRVNGEDKTAWAIQYHQAKADELQKLLVQYKTQNSN